MQDGETTDKSETPIYLQHVIDICLSYAKYGSENRDAACVAAARKLAIKVLWQVSRDAMHTCSVPSGQSGTDCI